MLSGKYGSAGAKGTKLPENNARARIHAHVINYLTGKGGI